MMEFTHKKINSVVNISILYNWNKSFQRWQYLKKKDFNDKTVTHFKLEASESMSKVVACVLDLVDTFCCW